MLPECVAALVAQPVLDHEVEVVHPRLPHLAPAVADDRRVRRPAEQGIEGGAPVERIRQERAAHVVHVVGVAVVRRAGRDDRLQGRRPERGDLERVEAAPAVAHHADVAVAPGLLRQPCDGLPAFVELLCQVFVRHQPVRIAAAAHVDPNGDVAVTGEIAMQGRIANRCELPLAVGQVFEDGRVAGSRGCAGVLGKEDSGRHLLGGAGDRNPGVLDLANSVGEVGDDAHCGLRIPGNRSRCGQECRIAAVGRIICQVAR